MYFRRLLIILTIISFSACSTVKKTRETPSKSALLGTHYLLKKLDGQVVTRPKNGRPVSFTLQEKDQHVSGFTGCNIFSGSFSLAQEKLQFSPLATTRKACPHLAVNEQKVLDVFNRVRSYSFKNKALQFKDKTGKTIAVFVEAPAQADIEGKYWKLMTLRGHKAKMGINQSQERYFKLQKKDHRITGYAGCNTFGGTYRLEGKKQIRFEKMRSTLKACPDSEIRDSALLKVLGETVEYTVQRDHLVLLDKKGNILASFKAVYF